jgi:hypothetical protein
VSNKQYDTRTGKEMHNDQMAEMMLKMGRDMNKLGKNQKMGSKLAFSH